MDRRKSKVEEAKETVQLAINNYGMITGLLGVSYPNGPLEHGTCRDINLELDVKKSKRVYEAILEVLNG